LTQFENTSYEEKYAEFVKYRGLNRSEIQRLKAKEGLIRRNQKQKKLSEAEKKRLRNIEKKRQAKIK